MSKLDISKIVQARLKPNQFFAQRFDKKQIVLHHTVSGAKAENVQADWNRTPARIGTAFIIDGDGDIYQCFSSAEWCHHLGCKTKNNTLLNQQSIGIEICAWGGITEKSGKFYNAYNREVPANEVVKLPKKWRGYDYFHKYNDKQIEATRQLLVYLCDTYKIPKTYQEDMWDVSKKALRGDAGVWTHVSFRKDKSDLFPQEEMIKMLKTFGNG
jgi:N-acetyl-anhydromuramyl-L-alanine amidase AmpD